MEKEDFCFSKENLEKIAQRHRITIEGLGPKIGLTESEWKKELENENGIHSEYIKRILLFDDKYTYLKERHNDYSIETLIKDIGKIKKSIDRLINETEFAYTGKPSFDLNEGDSYSDKVKRIAKELGMSAKELGKSIGYDNMGLNKDMDKTSGIRTEFILKLTQKYPDIINSRYIITGEGCASNEEAIVYANKELLPYRETIRELKRAKKILHEIQTKFNGYLFEKERKKK